VSASTAPPLVERDWFAQCTRCGLCLGRCPSFAALQVEPASPRGRVRLLADPQLRDAAGEHLASCFRCRMCEEGCPTAVPFGRLIRDWLVRDRRWSYARWRDAIDALAGVHGADVVARLAGAVEQSLAPPPPPGGSERAELALFCGPWISDEDAAAVVEARARAGVRAVVIDRGLAPQLLLDEGLWDEFVAACGALEARIAALSPSAAVEVLDPHCGRFIDEYDYWRGRPLVAAPRPSLLTLLQRCDAAARVGDGDVLDLTPATIGLVGATSEWLARSGRWVETLPSALAGAGALPHAEAPAAPLLRDLVADKRAWLAGRAGRLVTLDPFTRVRFADAELLTVPPRG
jgi:NAD-dependent dihydropyrimidine dehydrogenase PreA subunit